MYFFPLLPLKFQTSSASISAIFITLLAHLRFGWAKLFPRQPFTVTNTVFIDIGEWEGTIHILRGSVEHTKKTQAPTADMSMWWFERLRVSVWDHLVSLDWLPPLGSFIVFLVHRKPPWTNTDLYRLYTQRKYSSELIVIFCSNAMSGGFLDRFSVCP